MPALNTDEIYERESRRFANLRNINSQASSDPFALLSSGLTRSRVVYRNVFLFGPFVKLVHQRGTRESPGSSHDEVDDARVKTRLIDSPLLPAASSRSFYLGHGVALTAVVTKLRCYGPSVVKNHLVLLEMAFEQ